MNIGQKLHQIHEQRKLDKKIESLQQNKNKLKEMAELIEEFNQLNKDFNDTPILSLAEKLLIVCECLLKSSYWVMMSHFNNNSAQQISFSDSIVQVKAKCVKFMNDSGK